MFFIFQFENKLARYLFLISSPFFFFFFQWGNNSSEDLITCPCNRKAETWSQLFGGYPDRTKQQTSDEGEESRWLSCPPQPSTPVLGIWLALSQVSLMTPPPTCSALPANTPSGRKAILTSPSPTEPAGCLERHMLPGLPWQPKMPAVTWQPLDNAVM